MTTCLGKSCSFGLPRALLVNFCQFMYLVVSLLVLLVGCGDLIVSVYDHCLSFTFHVIGACILMENTDNKSLARWARHIQKYLLNLFCIVYIARSAVVLGKESICFINFCGVKPSQ